MILFVIPFILFCFSVVLVQRFKNRNKKQVKSSRVCKAKKAVEFPIEASDFEVNLRKSAADFVSKKS